MLAVYFNDVYRMLIFEYYDKDIKKIKTGSIEV